MYPLTEALYIHTAHLLYIYRSRQQKGKKAQNGKPFVQFWLE